MRGDWADGIEDRNYAIGRETDFRHMADPLWTILALSLLAAVSLFHSWERSQIVSLGYENQRLQALEEALLRSEKSLVLEEATLKDPERIDGLARMLGMSPIRPNQLLPVAYPEIEAPADALASQGDGRDAPFPAASRRLALATGSSVPTLEMKKLVAAN